MTIPGLFAPGGRTGLADARQFQAVAPLAWLTAQPSTKRFLCRCLENNIALPPSTNTLIQLQPGYEGYIKSMMLVGGWNSGINSGRNYALLVDGAQVWECHLITTGVNTASMDILPGGSDGLNTWLECDTWLPEQSLVSCTYNNNGGSTGDQIGMVIFGYYWPITLREDWAQRGWRK